MFVKRREIFKPNQVDSVGFLPLVSLMVFIAAFSLGFGPVPWILNVELIPPEARVSGNFIQQFLFESAGNLLLSVHHVQLVDFLPGGSPGSHHR